MWSLEFCEQLPITAWLWRQGTKEEEKAWKAVILQIIPREKVWHIQGSPRETLQISLEFAAILKTNFSCTHVFKLLVSPQANHNSISARESIRALPKTGFSPFATRRILTVEHGKVQYIFPYISSYFYHVFIWI